MGRIAGLVTQSPDRVDSVRSMLGNARSQSRPRIMCADNDLGGVGWAGPECDRAPPIARHGPLLLVVDGWIHDGRAPVDADDLLTRIELRGLESVLDTLIGAFAIVLLDDQRQTATLVRDRFGMRSLCYATHSRELAVASQPGLLWSLPWLERTPDPRYVAVYAGAHYRAFDHDLIATPFLGVFNVPAAHLVHWSNGRAICRRWWQLRDHGDAQESEAALAETYRDLLLDAVRIRLPDRDVAFSLSGGMDSSSVISAAVHEAGPQHAYTTVYTDPTYDESGDIAPMLDGQQITWHPVPVGDVIDFDDLAAVIRLHDEPIATATWLSYQRLCEAVARDGVKVLFGGLGGDELNAGEYEHFWFHFADLCKAGDERRLEAEIDAWALNHDHPIHRKSRAIAEATIPRVADLARPGWCRPDPDRLWRYRSLVDPDFYDLSRIEIAPEHPFSSYLKNRTFQDLTRETMPCCLRAEDRQGAFFGVENRLPFLDHRLVEFMFRVPGDLKIRDGVTKILLRRAMQGILPEPTRTRVAKTGWNAPAHRWFSGPGRMPLLDLIHSQSFRERGIYRLGKVLAIIEEHETIVRDGLPRENHMMFLWQLVNLELWLRQLDERRVESQTSVSVADVTL